VPEAEFADPFGVALGHLVVGERRQQGGRGAENPNPGQHRAAAPAPEQQHLGDEREDGEVMGRQSQGRENAPEDGVALLVAAPLALQRPHAEEQREGAEQPEQRVGPCLLRVPDQHRVDGDEGGGEEAGAGAPQFAADEVGDGDRRHPGEG
jgi:hypothetical protein